MKIHAQGCAGQRRGGGRPGIGLAGRQNRGDVSVRQLADNLKADATIGTGHYCNHVLVRSHSTTPDTVFLSVGAL
jgi:hypothetical protein